MQYKQILYVSVAKQQGEQVLMQMEKNVFYICKWGRQKIRNTFQYNAVNLDR